ncbi:MAG: hypothetical protein RLZZ330_113 [Actinomycetota bacterium]|jgi:tight adherence protein C
MTEILSTRGLVGLLFGFGFFLTLTGIRSAPNISIFVKTAWKKHLHQQLFVQGFIFAIFGAALSAVFLGFLTQNLLVSVIALFVGAYLGQQVFMQRNKTISAETDLRLKLESGGFLDLVGLAVSCGFSLRYGISQAVSWSNRDVIQIWTPLISDLEANQSLSVHLEKITETNRENTMGRIARTLLISRERGTPVSQTLSSLAAEIRSDTRRELLEIAAKKDVAMMLPVVFGILPSVTAIALYPAFVSLSIM